MMMEMARADTTKHPPSDSAATVRKLFMTPAEKADGGEVLNSTSRVEY